MKRLKKAIVLYMPNKLDTSYSAIWDETDLGVLGILADSNLDLTSFVDATGSLKSDAITESLKKNLPAG